MEASVVLQMYSNRPEETASYTFRVEMSEDWGGQLPQNVC